MKRKQIIIILCLFICAILSFQAVSAESYDIDNTNDIGDNNLSLSMDNDIQILDSQKESLDDLDDVNDLLSLPTGNDSVIGDGEKSFTQLNEAINSVSDPEIILNYNYMFTENDGQFKDGITIDRDVTILGDNHVIDGANLARIFNIAEGYTVTIKALTFTNANTNKPGGAIFAKGKVIIENCRFIDNTVTYANGGAICLSGFGSTITNSYFKGNKAIKNPDNVNSGAGGAVFVDANNTSISNSIFTENNAGLNGGAIGSSTNRIQYCTVTNCTITSNTANGSAGGIGMQGSNFHVSDTTFKYNEAKGIATTIYPGNGGGLVMRGWDSYAYNCTFINNTAANHGGAAYSTNTSFNPTNNNTGFELCTFINNTAGFNGGAVDWAKGATYGYIKYSTFTNNTAGRSGGAVHWSGHEGTILHSTFTNNKALGTTGAFCCLVPVSAGH